MTLNNATIKKMESEFPFTLTPEQKSILLLWFGSDSKFGWSKLDFLVGIHRVRQLYPDHRSRFRKSFDRLSLEPAADFVFNHDGYGNPVIRLYDNDLAVDGNSSDDDDIPF